MDNPIINGLYVLVLGILVIFFGMIVIVLAVSICGKLMSNGTEVKKVEKSVEPKPVVQVEPQAEEIPDHIKVAIIGAISAYYFNSQSKCDFIVKKIKRF